MCKSINATHLLNMFFYLPNLSSISTFLSSFFSSFLPSSFSFLPSIISEKCLKDQSDFRWAPFSSVQAYTILFYLLLFWNIGEWHGACVMIPKKQSLWTDIWFIFSIPLQLNHIYMWKNMSSKLFQFSFKSKTIWHS